MVTFHAICYAHHRHNDGTYPVKIKVYFKGKAVHIPTNIAAHPSDLTRSLHLKSPQLIAATNELIDQMRQAIADLTYFDMQERDCEWIVAHIRKKLTEAHFKLNFYEFCLPLATSVTARCALNSWRKFAGVDIDINDITAKMLSDYVEWMGKRENTTNGNSTNYYLIQLGKMYRLAKEKYNDEDAGVIVIPKSPFQRVRVKRQPCEGQKNIGVDVIQRMIDSRCEGKMQEAVDVFLISFALMGANLADLWNYREKNGWWIYNRAKTCERRGDKAEMRVRIPECIRERIERTDIHRHKDAHSANLCINRMLKLWAAANDIDKFSFYAARHSWASIARSIGIEKATIDECLAHIGDYQIADIYAERNWDAINGANTQVIALFKW